AGRRLARPTSGRRIDADAPPKHRQRHALELTEPPLSSHEEARQIRALRAPRSRPLGAEDVIRESPAEPSERSPHGVVPGARSAGQAVLDPRAQGDVTARAHAEGEAAL